MVYGGWHNLKKLYSPRWNVERITIKYVHMAVALVKALDACPCATEGLKTKKPIPTSVDIRALVLKSDTYGR